MTNRVGRVCSIGAAATSVGTPVRAHLDLLRQMAVNKLLRTSCYNRHASKPIEAVMTNDTDASAKLWGGRFSEPTDQFVERFTASIGFDARLYHHDIQGSIAHARMLAHVGVLSDNESGAIIAGLTQIRQQIEAGKLTWSVALEDVHMNIESRLIEIVGDVGKRLHTGRSRNDQVATDVRLYLRDEIDVIIMLVTRLMSALTRPRRSTRRYDHARVYPSANGAARDVRASHARLVRDAGCAIANGCVDCANAST